MKSQTVAQLLAPLGIIKSHSRPHVSNDNPFSESQFKTLKYRPEFPDRFASIEHGLDFCGKFFHWQNHEHHHWGLGLLTPATVHCGQADTVLAAHLPFPFCTKQVAEGSIFLGEPLQATFNATLLGLRKGDDTVVSSPACRRSSTPIGWGESASFSPIFRTWAILGPLSYLVHAGSAPRRAKYPSFQSCSARDLRICTHPTQVVLRSFC